MMHATRMVHILFRNARTIVSRMRSQVAFSTLSKYTLRISSLNNFLEYSHNVTWNQTTYCDRNERVGYQI